MDFDETGSVLLATDERYNDGNTWCCDSVGGLGEYVTCHMFGLLVMLFCFFSDISPPDWTSFDSQYFV